MRRTNGKAGKARSKRGRNKKWGGEMGVVGVVLRATGLMAPQWPCKVGMHKSL